MANVPDGICGRLCAKPCYSPLPLRNAEELTAQVHAGR